MGHHRGGHGGTYLGHIKGTQGRDSGDGDDGGGGGGHVMMMMELSDEGGGDGDDDGVKW